MKKTPKARPRPRKKKKKRTYHFGGIKRNFIAPLAVFARQVLNP